MLTRNIQIKGTEYIVQSLTRLVIGRCELGLDDVTSNALWIIDQWPVQDISPLFIETRNLVDALVDSTDSLLRKQLLQIVLKV